MGLCTSAGGTVQLLDDDTRTDAESNRISERDTAIEQHIGNLEHHIADLTLKIQQLEDNATDKDEQIDSLKQEQHSFKQEQHSFKQEQHSFKQEQHSIKQEFVGVKDKLENDLTALRADFKNLQSELQRKSTSTSIVIHHADAVNATGAATHSKTTTSYTASEMMVDNSNVTSVNTKETHNSVNKNTDARTDNTNQIPSPRPNWKLF